MVDVLINQSGTLYAIMSGFTTDISGSWFLTCLLVVIAILLIALALHIPLEFTAVLVMPLLLVFMAFSGDFASIGGIFLIYLGILLAKNFLFGR